MPPSGQGLTALVMLNIPAGFDHSKFARTALSAFTFRSRRRVRAYSVRDAFVADPEFGSVPTEELLDICLRGRPSGAD